MQNSAAPKPGPLLDFAVGSPFACRVAGFSPHFISGSEALDSVSIGIEIQTGKTICVIPNRPTAHVPPGRLGEPLG